MYRILIAQFISLLLIVSPAIGAPKAKLWNRWLAHNPDSKTTINHSIWDTFLRKYVVISTEGINRVRYSKVSKKAQRALIKYIEKLSTVAVSSLNRDEQLAYWINLYNALTVNVILDHYPVESIRDIDISPRWFSDGPWGKKLITVEGEELSLDDIEHRILRPIWKDPRIHYAVNCAALGCPNLQREAFTAENTERLLDKGAQEYINHPRGVTFEEGRLKVSSIYVWFKEDFGGDDASVIKHLKQYASSTLRSPLNSVDSISNHDYDWSLNKAR